MKEKLLIIDNDDTAIQTIGQLARIFNIDTVVMHNWGKSLNLLEDEKIIAVFVNVELEMINLDVLLRKFNSPEENTEKIPVFFLYSRLFGKAYQKAKHLAHAGELKKPVDVRLFIELLNRLVKLEDKIDYKEKAYRDKLKKFKTYEKEMGFLMQKLQEIME